MTNALYDKAKESFGKAEIDWLNDDIKVALVDTTAYTVDLATHQFYSDLAGVVTNSGNLTTKTIAAGKAKADDLTYLAVAAGPGACALVVYQDTGVAISSRLIAYIDAGGGSLPVTPDGTDIAVFWDAVDGIFIL